MEEGDARVDSATIEPEGWGAWAGCAEAEMVTVEKVETGWRLTDSARNTETVTHICPATTTALTKRREHQGAAWQGFFRFIASRPGRMPTA
jgi:hypothetical protein